MIRVIGVDAGDTVGIGLVEGRPEHYLDRFEVAQCSAGMAVGMVAGLAAEMAGLDGIGDPQVVISAEEFRVGAASARSGQAGVRTRAMVEELRALARALGVAFVSHPAVAVKAWATNTRLNRAGLVIPRGLSNHGADGCRHALYAAVHNAGLTDPMARTSQVDTPRSPLSQRRRV